MTTDKPTPEPVDVVKQEFEKQFAHMDLTSYGGKMYNSKRTNNVYIGFKRAWNMRDVSPDEPSELRQAGVSSELFDQQKAAGHDFTVNDEGMAFCKQCGDFMTFPAKPCLQPAAQKTEGELIRCWELIKNTAVDEYDPISKNSGLLFKNHKTGNFAFISEPDLQAMEAALASRASVDVWQDIESAPDGKSVWTIKKIAMSDGYFSPDVLYRNGDYWFYDVGRRANKPDLWQPYNPPAAPDPAKFPELVGGRDD